jgi:hypothetical protein
MEDVMGGRAVVLKGDQTRPFWIKFPYFALIQVVPAQPETAPAFLKQI